MRTLRFAAGTLEPQVAAHADEMFAVLADPAIYEFENEPPRSVEGLRERYTRLESRGSPDGREGWLNWVLRDTDGRAAGYLQATTYDGGRADVAYELASAHWGRGLAAQAVQAMLDELVAQHGVNTFDAVLKRANHRSLALLQRLGFEPAGASAEQLHGIEPDERMMRRNAAADALVLRLLLPQDLDAAIDLWRATPGVGLSAADAPAALQRYLARNPGCSVAATRGTRLVGTLLAGHDGRRGLIHHLAVATTERRHGLARAMLERSLAALRRAGIHKCHLMVQADNAGGLAFWRAAGAMLRVELQLMSLPTPPP
jgi:RimJ/RimL family protein N-acetyltransferase